MRCRIVGQFQKEQPFIRSECPQGGLWRPIAGLDEARVLYLFDVLVVLPFQCVESLLCVLILDLECASVEADLNFLFG
uniref:Uncharacterized protein n=1 Tax=Thermosporothrix sp. COM3 TaxID=2490863 RepID=A0A455SA76_9CHLR|nr:hypothetical protein KTC_01080 [Thermosporothrix sp. COM3]